MDMYINKREAIVPEAIDGFLRASKAKLARLDGFPHIKVVLRAERSPDKVSVICGGGSGHEPSHAGFVGTGFLTAAVCGDIFASPSADAILAAILATTGDAGCLLILKNYTGDRLNFGLAAERARALGKMVNMIIIDDDVALPDIAQPRGIAGALLVNKIAGAMAESGADLDAITKEVERAIEDVVTIGMSLDTCTIPGAGKEDRIAPGKAELGLGVHGEPGAEQIDFTGATDSMRRIVDKLADHVGDGPHVALINNLGSTTPLEMSILTEELFRSKVGDQVKYVVGPAALMTSLDMHGFSVSLMPVDDGRLKWLSADASETAWPGMVEAREIVTEPMPDGLSPEKPAPSDDPEAKELIESCCGALLGMEKDLNALDAKSGDGDTGATVAAAARALVDALGDLPLADKPALFRSIARNLSQTMGGSSGVLMAIFFSAAGEAAEQGAGVIDSLKAGLKRMREVGGAEPGDRTMIDALQPALDALPDGAGAAASAARKGADHTAEITTAKAGRSTYVSADNLKGNNDPGAEAVARLFEHLSRR